MACAQDIMSSNVVSVNANDSVDTVAKVFLETRHHSVPVVDEQGRLQGIISQEDLIDARRKVHLPTVFTLLDSFIPLGGFQEFAHELRKATASTALELASTEVVTARPEESADDVAEKLAHSHIHALPVVDGENRLLGIVTRSDVLRELIQRSRG
ncbi:CBS domain-containing protein [Thermithiobacillus plumbiphilus]|uniref:CBS domain-containing protein n=1 Tax=Thermithiobacillus plumbiphilus TaxID=1729899 RepID=A0ABU9DAQ5_9PROT